MEKQTALRFRANLGEFGSGAIKVKSPASADPTFIPFKFLHSKVPEPFREEISGGMGQVIHHKFVVVDFNDANPAVFAGSSNLAAGGEHENGDNLLAFRDPAIRLNDHYRFRAAMETATSAEPLRLRTRKEHWGGNYFDPESPKYRERLLFAGEPSGAEPS